MSGSDGSAVGAEAAAEDAPARGFQSVDEVAAFLDIPKRRLLHALYGEDDGRRYRSFEIPKRTGGVRRIDAPIGVVRTAQKRLAVYLAGLHRPHPASHGFLPGRSIVSNAAPHKGQRLVLNIDLAEFFPSVNFGRVRGLFLAAPFHMAPAAATVCAQICTYKNGLPQGAPTSPALSNFIASQLDRKISRLARENGLRYSRYADDLTLSTARSSFPAKIATVPGGYEAGGVSLTAVALGEATEAAITGCGFAVNPKKVRLQTRAVRQSVTGLTVNEKPNVDRRRIRRIRAMIHAWRKHGIEAAGTEHARRWRPSGKPLPADVAGRRFRNALYGELAFVKMVRGADDPLFLKLCGEVLPLDPNPSKFLRQMVFGADDFAVFISHATEDKEEVARPIYAALQAAGVKAFLDEEHIGWGENFTTKINIALGAARTVIAIVTPTSVAKAWPVAEINAALAMEVDGEKAVLPVVVGRPDLTKLPLLRAKNHIAWTGDPAPVVAAFKAMTGVVASVAVDPMSSPRRSWFGLGKLLRR